MAENFWQSQAAELRETIKTLKELSKNLILLDIALKLLEHKDDFNPEEVEYLINKFIEIAPRKKIELAIEDIELIAKRLITQGDISN